MSFGGGKDSFDRLLVAQAQIEGITLLTTDENVARYPGPIRAFKVRSATPPSPIPRKPTD